MTLQLDEYYLNMCSSRLELFKRKSPSLWNFRCPYCGDSTRSKIKARGYVFRDDTHLVFKCHNCSKTTNILGLLEKVNPPLVREYRLARFKENRTQRSVLDLLKTNAYTTENVETTTKSTAAFLTQEHFHDRHDTVVEEIGLLKISELNENHLARRYVYETRKLPKNRVDDLYYAEFFGEWVDRYTNGKVSISDYSERIVIPFRDRTGEIYACQGRSLPNNKKAPKYLTIKFDDTRKKIFGLERWNPNSLTYVVEGPFDSMFLPNALAASGLDFPKDFLNSAKTILVFDNEKRNIELCKQMRKSLLMKYYVCVWPEQFKYKDINEAIISGQSVESIMSIINKNSYKGPIGILKLNSWSRR